MTQTHRQRRTKRAVPVSGGQYLELAIPYYFSSLAREREQDIRVGDYVRVRSLDKRYEIMDVFPQHSSVRVREVGSTEEMVLPWHLVTPWQKQGHQVKVPHQSRRRLAVQRLLRVPPHPAGYTIDGQKNPLG